MVDEAIPGFSRACVEKLVCRAFDPLNRDMDHQTAKAGIAHQQVAASPKHEQRQTLPARKGHGLLDVGFRAGRGEVARGAADTKGGKRGEGYIFADLELRLHELEHTTAVA